MRKHLSAIKGGRLAAAAAPARVVTLAISDVPGDDPAVIGSGPTVARPHDLRRCPRHPGEVPHRAAAGGGGASGGGGGRDAEARRQRLRARRVPADRDAASALEAAARRRARPA